MKEYITNPNKRCRYCKGREVITVENGIAIYNNLVEIPIDGKPSGYFMCKDEKECKQNIDAENTIVNYEEGEDGKPRMTKIVKDGEAIMEVDYNDT